jgi:hypothetical protein
MFWSHAANIDRRTHIGRKQRPEVEALFVRSGPVVRKAAIAMSGARAIAAEVRST